MSAVALGAREGSVALGVVPAARRGAATPCAERRPLRDGHPRGSAPQARSMLERYGAEKSSDPRLRFDLGQVYLQLMEYAKAAKVLKSVLAEHPDHPAADDGWVRLAFACGYMADHECEQKAYIQVLRRATDEIARATPTLNLAETEMHLGNLREAVEGYREALRIAGRVPTGETAPLAVWGLAVALDRSGDRLGAEKRRASLATSSASMGGRASTSSVRKASSSCRPTRSTVRGARGRRGGEGVNDARREGSPRARRGAVVLQLRALRRDRQGAGPLARPREGPPRERQIGAREGREEVRQRARACRRGRRRGASAVSAASDKRAARDSAVKPRSTWSAPAKISRPAAQTIPSSSFIVTAPARIARSSRCSPRAARSAT